MPCFNGRTKLCLAESFLTLQYYSVYAIPRKVFILTPYLMWFQHFHVKWANNNFGCYLTPNLDVIYAPSKSDTVRGSRSQLSNLVVTHRSHVTNATCHATSEWKVSYVSICAFLSSVLHALVWVTLVWKRLEFSMPRAVYHLEVKTVYVWDASKSFPCLSYDIWF